MKRILAVGAFERDNFGDLLFLRVLRDFMEAKGVEVTPASIIFSDMREVNGEVVYPYELMLSLYEWDAVWVVGGEVGGVDIASAVLMDAADARGRHYSALNANDKEAYNALLHIPTGDSLSAYLPKVRGYAKNRNTPIVVNSVGISNSAPGTEMSKNEIAVLSQAVVSVREEKSAKFCKENNIRCMLSPDVVSAISHFHPYQVEQAQEPYIVVQVNHELLSQSELAKFTSDLKEVSEYLEAKIVLLRAGVTFGHDDSSLYEEIIAEFKSLKPKYAIEQYDKRNPLLITELIAKSKLCIATSLHCRIVSESYSVPHISLSNNKVANYASTWADDMYPYNVDVTSLKNTVIEIKESIDHPVESNKLGSRALKNLEDIYGQIATKDKSINRGDKLQDGEVFIEYARGQKDTLDTVFTTILSEREAHYAHAQKLGEHLQELEDQIAQDDSDIRALKNSKSYKIGYKITKPYRILKRLTSRMP